VGRILFATNFVKPYTTGEFRAEAPKDTSAVIIETGKQDCTCNLGEDPYQTLMYFLSLCGHCPQPRPRST
jgi:hypothetical protein